MKQWSEIEEDINRVMGMEGKEKDDSNRTYTEALNFILEGHKKRDLFMSKFPIERKYKKGCLKCKVKKAEGCSCGDRGWSEEYIELNHKKSCEHIDELIYFLQT